MPLGPYKDWDECIAKNQDKADPAAYCGSLERKGKVLTMHIALMLPEGTWTTDHRFIEPGVLTWRDPAPLMLLLETSEQHQGAEFAGNLHQFRRVEIKGVPWVVANVQWDDSENGREGERLVQEGRMPWLSADIGGVTSVVEVTKEEDGIPVEFQERVTAGEIVGATQLPMSAFGEARIVSAEDFARMTVVTASARCPKCYSLPTLDKLTPLTVEPCGDHHRVYGHIARAGSCHLGRLAAYSMCVPPLPVEGAEVPLAFTQGGTGHPPDSLSREEAKAWYEKQRLASMVAAWDTDLGPFCSGTVAPEVDEISIKRLGRADVSGDWRWDGEAMPLVAVSVLPDGVLPAYPVRALVASGQVLSYQAGWHRPSEEVEALAVLNERVEKLERARQVERFRARLSG